MNYRKEIDGLRAIAVLAVIFFHAGFGVFSGGFVGVDVFFVISGYLITLIIITDLDNKRFSFKRFYERRARRILPALFFVVSFSFVAGWYLMLPSQLEALSKSVLAVLAFVSNILFWRESGYFAAASELKPLLHTWSLAVEEQYYLTFPIILILAWRFGRKKVMTAIVVVFVMSFLLSEWGWRYEPTANFYLLPTRVWELLAGSISAFIVSKHGVKNNNAISMAGLILIGAGIFMLDSGTPFPSSRALLPVGGTCALLLFSGRNTLTTRLLGNRILVGIGLISYSLYLWHQPLFAFVRIGTIQHPSLFTMLALCLLAVALAFLTWKFIEQPFRQKDSFWANNVWFVSFCIAGYLLLTIVGILGIRQAGFPNRFDNSQQEVIEYLTYSRESVYREGECFLKPFQGPTNFLDTCYGDKKILIWGDSHAAALSYGVRNANDKVAQLTASACPPLLGYTNTARPHCASINEAVVQFIKETRPTSIILHANWNEYNIEETGQLKNTLSLLQEIGIEQVVVIGSIPHYFPTLPERMLFNGLSLDTPSEIEVDFRNLSQVDSTLRTTSESYGVEFVSVLDSLCSAEKCVATFKARTNVIPIVWDNAHLTAEGSIFLVDRLREKLQFLQFERP